MSQRTKRWMVSISDPLADKTGGQVSCRDSRHRGCVHSSVIKVSGPRYLCKLQIGIAAFSLSLSFPSPFPPSPRLCHLLMRTIASKRLGMLPVERTRNRTADTFLRYRLPSFVPPPPRLRDDRASTFRTRDVSCPNPAGSSKPRMGREIKISSSKYIYMCARYRGNNKK